MIDLTLPQLHDQQQLCTLCPLHEQATNVGISTHYLSGSLAPEPHTTALVVVGQNPGYEEDQRNEPFCSKISGRLMREAYLKSPISFYERCSIYLTNVARCFTVDNVCPSASQGKACRPYLLDDLQALSQHHERVLVLCAGAFAATHTFAVLGLGKVSLAQALTKQGTKADPNLCLFSTYYPAYLARSPQHTSAVEDHMALLASALDGHLPAPSTPNIQPLRPPKGNPYD